MSAPVRCISSLHTKALQFGFTLRIVFFLAYKAPQGLHQNVDSVCFVRRELAFSHLADDIQKCSGLFPEINLLARPFLDSIATVPQSGAQ